MDLSSDGALIGRYLASGLPFFCGKTAESLTTLQEYDNNGAAAEGSW